MRAEAASVPISLATAVGGHGLADDVIMGGKSSAVNLMSQRLIASLHSSACYAHETSGIRVLETHISWVVLTGPYAYKIKKPVNPGFLDFSTLEKRRYFCAEELRLNARFSRGLYLEVVAISGSEEAPAV